MESIPGSKNPAAQGLAALCATLLVACAPSPRSAVEGVLVADEEIALVRGERVDAARREFPVDGNATYVAMLEENDTDIKVALSHSAVPGTPVATVERDSSLSGEGIEIAVLDAPAGSRLLLLLEGAPDSELPGKARLKLMRYDPAISKDPRVAARLAALRAWSAATTERLTGEDPLNTALRDIDRALEHLESAEGDPALAGWGRMVRSRLNYRQYANFKMSLADAERAEREFTAAGSARNAARARMQQAAVMVEIANDMASKEPTAAEAALRAKKILVALSTEPVSSPLERARAVNYLGVLAFHVYDLAEARTRFLEVIPAFEAIGNHQGRLTANANLGALATLEGDYRAASRYFDQLIDESFRYQSITVRAMNLINAATIDSFAGNVDRSIERFMRALELTREHQMKHNEARVLHGLGMDYWAMGDTAQATALLGEALKLRRTIDDASGLMLSLSANGTLAREAGDIQKALTLHREAASLAAAADTRMYALWDMSLDYQAASDYPRAIAAAREALAVHEGLPYFYRRHAVQLALADMLLAQPRRVRSHCAKPRRSRRIR